MIEINTRTYDSSLVVKITLGIATDEEWMNPDEAGSLLTTLEDAIDEIRLYLEEEST